MRRREACVKELLENALDASARRVSVRLVEQGLELLEVSDDGLGIAAEDFHRVAQRHTTSKIGSYEDLSGSEEGRQRRGRIYSLRRLK